MANVVFSLFPLVILCIIFTDIVGKNCYNDDSYRFYTISGSIVRMPQMGSCFDLNKVYDCTKDIRKQYHPDSPELKFEVFAKRYAECYAKQILKFDPEWIELYGQHSKLKEPIFRGLRVTFAVKNVKFSKPQSVAAKPEVAFRNFAYNLESSAEIKNTIENSVEKVTTLSTTKENSWKVEQTVEMGIKDPITESGVTAKISMFYESSQGKTNEDSKSVKYTLEDVSTVPPNTAGRLMWTKTLTDTETKWKSSIEVSGWIAVSKEYSYIYFLPVVDMATVFDEYMVKLGENTIGLKTSGVMKISDAVVSDATIDQYTEKELSSKKNQCPSDTANITFVHKG